MADTEETKRVSGTAYLALMLTAISTLGMVALYFWSVYQVFTTPNSSIARTIICIPGLGQLLWLGASWASGGIFSPYALGVYAWGIVGVSGRIASGVASFEEK